MTPYIFKICTQAIWDEAITKGQFDGAGIDLEDGYIHFSTAEQVAETAWLHFNGLNDLVLVKVRVDGLALKWEESRGGQSFPHLYDALSLEFVEDVFPMPLATSGEHVFPNEIPPRRGV
ncbi:MAG: DUF952 domain-containing protein [Alphaproteobacteria bacterium]|nr:DUF952 domain-containing protein [Alphaproteobacteria bacterium]